MVISESEAIFFLIGAMGGLLVGFAFGAEQMYQHFIKKRRKLGNLGARQDA